MRLSLVILFIFFLGSCKMQKGKVADVKASPPQASVMSCVIKGEIVEVLKPGTGADSICAKYPCRARVRILDVLSCGSSVSLFFNSGDTLEMSFAYTLSDTRKAFPGLKERLPGLKKGNTFTANASQRMRPGTGEYFVIYGYQKE